MLLSKLMVLGSMEQSLRERFKTVVSYVPPSLVVCKNPFQVFFSFVLFFNLVVGEETFISCVNSIKINATNGF